MSILWQFVLITLLIFNLPVLIYANDNLRNRFQPDFQGEAHYSRYNFTDIKKPYDGVDGFAESKLAYWLDDSKTISPYVSIIPSSTTESEFWWQKNVQMGLGLQFYPFIKFGVADSMGDLRSIRFYALSAWQHYYDKPAGAEPEDEDIQIGLDYYYDSLFEEEFRLIVQSTLPNILTFYQIQLHLHLLIAEHHF